MLKHLIQLDKPNISYTDTIEVGILLIKILYHPKKAQFLQCSEILNRINNKSLASLPRLPRVNNFSQFLA